MGGKNACLNDKLHPNIFQIFGGEDKVPMNVLTALFGELLTILGKKQNSVDFTYLNGKKGRVVIVSQVKSLPSFIEQARRLQWINSMWIIWLL